MSNRVIYIKMYLNITLGTSGELLKLRQVHLPRFASVYSAANEYQHCWEGTCDGLASCPGESVQLHSNCLR